MHKRNNKITTRFMHDKNLWEETRSDDFRKWYTKDDYLDWAIGKTEAPFNFRMKGFLDYAGGVVMSLCFVAQNSRIPLKENEAIIRQVKWLGNALSYFLRRTREGHFIRHHMNPNDDFVRWGCQNYGLNTVYSFEGPYMRLLSMKRDLRYPQHLITDGGEVSFYSRISSLGSLAFMYKEFCNKIGEGVRDPLIHSLITLHSWLELRDLAAQVNYGRRDSYRIDKDYKSVQQRYRDAATYRLNRLRGANLLKIDE